MITTLAVEQYRSLRRLVLRLGPLTVVTGPNGSGKSNLYRAFRLLADSARTGAVAALAREGGLPSALWAGPPTDRDGPVQGTVRRGPVSLRLGFGADDFGYAIDLGMPVGHDSAFDLDPEIKRESTWRGPVLRPATLLADRHGGVVRVRDGSGSWRVVRSDLPPYDGMLNEAVEPDILLVRERIRSWRFYDHVRTDPDAPARRPQVGTRTPVLGHDGADLAAALQTIREVGDFAALDKAVDQAFPGSRVEIRHEPGRFELALRQPGLLRPLGAAELSDGTLRFLLLVAALLTPRPPALMVLNEPETSLHPDLLPPLADLITTAAGHVQLVVVTHSGPLVAALAACGDPRTVELVKDRGRTRVVGQEPLDEPPWHWPKR